jgi:hypothetical protein
LPLSNHHIATPLDIREHKLPWYNFNNQSTATRRRPFEGARARCAPTKTSGCEATRDGAAPAFHERCSLRSAVLVAAWCISITIN